MPNWCNTQLEINGCAESIARLKQDYFSDGVLDFDRVIPMPKPLDIVASSVGSIGYDALHGDWQRIAGYAWIARHGPFETREALLAHLRALDAKEDQPGNRYLEQGRAYADSGARFGYPTWWEWRIAHWGTKWNLDSDSFTLEADEPCGLSMWFDTAWSPALPILEALTQRFPELSLRMIYADDGGGFAGEAIGETGELTDTERDWQAVMIDHFGLECEDDDEESPEPVAQEVSS